MYNTEVFEKAALKRGYVIESIQKADPNNVLAMSGAVIEETLVKRVRWDETGRCFSFRCKRLAKYDLPLNEVAQKKQRR